jgi:hypothetical protein
MLDFVSYCGGSLGLFLGFSAISAVEIVYYFTLRLVCKRKQQKKVENFQDNSEQRETQQKTNYLKEFADASSIHGFNQISFVKRHPIER